MYLRDAILALVDSADDTGCSDDLTVVSREALRAVALFIQQALQAPTVNLNGTSADSLLDAYANAGTALRAAQTALEATAPHARDFQTDSTGLAYGRARQQHEERDAALRNILTELTLLSENVSEQQDRRNRITTR